MEPEKTSHHRAATILLSQGFSTEGDNEKARIQISWKDVTFKVKSKANPDAEGFTELVHSVSGVALAGEILAVMGCSGAGKTTVLNVLSDRLSHPNNTKVTGQVQANNRDISTIDYKSYVGYVMQDDVLLETMTPRECLNFAARMKLKGSKEDRRNRVEKLLKKLKLKEVADNRIGSDLKRGLSGGERRRVSIATELIVDPSVIFLDGTFHSEPTSGLDSANAFNVMSILDSLADSGITIILTIHHPSIEIFNLFDKLILMMEGYTVYQGPAELALARFKELGFEPPLGISAPDFFMRVLHVANRDQKTEEEKRRLDTFITHYSPSLGLEKADAQLRELLQSPFIYRPNCVEQFTCLLRRAAFSLIRNPITTYVRVTQDVVYTVLMILVFNGMNDGYRGVEDRRGLLFFLEICMIQGALLDVILAFPIERALFLKEQAQSLYGVVPYFLAKVISEAPMNLFTPTVLCAAVFFGTGLNFSSTGKLFTYSTHHPALIMVLLHGIGESLGLIIGAFIPDATVAPTAGFVRYIQLLAIPFMMFGGFFITVSDIPASFQWFAYLSDLEFVVANKVTHIINCAGRQVPNHWEPIGVRYLAYQWLDQDVQVQLDPRDEVFREVYAFIEKASNTGESVLIHGVRDLSKSTILTASYLMRKFRWAMFKTLEFISSRVQNVHLSPGFIHQLGIYEARMGKAGFPPKTSDWDSAEFEDSEEALLQNTFLNSKQTPMPPTYSVPSKRGTDRIAWRDNGTGELTRLTAPHPAANNPTEDGFVVLKSSMKGGTGVMRVELRQPQGRRLGKPKIDYMPEHTRYTKTVESAVEYGSVKPSDDKPRGRPQDLLSPTGSKEFIAYPPASTKKLRAASADQKDTEPKTVTKRPGKMIGQEFVHIGEWKVRELPAAAGRPVPVRPPNSTISKSTAALPSSKRPVTAPSKRPPSPSLRDGKSRTLGQSKTTSKLPARSQPWHM